jgi:hypothetical protein
MAYKIEEIEGIGPSYAGKLSAAKIKEINDEKNLANAAPAESVVEGWVAKAKELDPKISY